MFVAAAVYLHGKIMFLCSKLSVRVQGGRPVRKLSQLSMREIEMA